MGKKKGKYKLTVYSDSKDVLKQFHTFVMSDADQLCLIYDEETGTKCYYPDIEWNSKDREDLDLVINCDYEQEYER